MRPVKLLLLSLLLSASAYSPAALEPGFDEPAALPAGGTLAIPLLSDGEAPDLLPAGLREALATAIEAGGFKGKPGEVLVLYAVAGFDKVIAVGMGTEALSARHLQDFGGHAAKQIGEKAIAPVSVLWPGLPVEEDYPAAHIALGLKLGDYRFDKYKSPEGEAEATGDIAVTVFSEGAKAQAGHWRAQWAGLAEAVYFTRDLINEPANVIYPESFVARTREAFRGVDNVSIRTLDVRQMEKLGMGAMLGVGMGSERPPRLLVVHYRGGDKGQDPLAFVGKGVTFDSGGISIKGVGGMWRMKFDMSGAAAATGTVLALAKRRAPVNAVAVAALVENMPSERAQRPGDVRSTMSGKTIEVINTDAEGRLILADAVWYTQQEFAPALMVDLATLTGAAKMALGQTYCGLFTRHDDLAQQLLAAGRGSGEELWRLPLHPDFRKAIQSDIADIKNESEGGWGEASIGAEVIGTFVEEDTRWAHLDIVPQAWTFEPGATTQNGGVGWGVRLLNQLVLDYYQ